jgi:Raf kinase inhibitor-like YbhB/YbcL family protein
MEDSGAPEGPADPGAVAGASDPAAQGGASDRFPLTSDAFAANTRIPERFTPAGDNIAPPLAWTGVPQDAHEFALICDGLDAAEGEPAVHWVLWGIPPRIRSIAEGLPNNPILGRERSMRHGLNDWGTLGWTGPEPPPGEVHRYRCRVFALDTKLFLPIGSTKAQLEAAMEGHVLATGELIGTHRK